MSASDHAFAEVDGARYCKDCCVIEWGPCPLVAVECVYCRARVAPEDAYPSNPDEGLICRKCHTEGSR